MSTDECPDCAGLWPVTSPKCPSCGLDWDDVEAAAFFVPGWHE